MTSRSASKVLSRCMSATESRSELYHISWAASCCASRLGQASRVVGSESSTQPRIMRKQRSTRVVLSRSGTGCCSALKGTSGDHWLSSLLKMCSYSLSLTCFLNNNLCVCPGFMPPKDSPKAQHLTSRHSQDAGCRLTPMAQWLLTYT